MGQQSDMMNQLSRLGMGNTTVGAGLGQGIQRGMQENLNRAADQMQGTKLGIMERRTDQYPDNAMILALANSLGQNSGGQGRGGIMNALGGMTMGGSGSRRLTSTRNNRETKRCQSQSSTEMPTSLRWPSSRSSWALGMQGPLSFHASAVAWAGSAVEVEAEAAAAAAAAADRPEPLADLESCRVLRLITA
jgi:hypothetical protein